jgi:hypothetical protein
MQRNSRAFTYRDIFPPRPASVSYRVYYVPDVLLDSESNFLRIKRAASHVSAANKRCMR